jgi:hypothetical protein
MDHDGGVVDPVRIPQRCTDHQHRHQLGGCLGDVEHRVLDAVQQRVLQQDVLDRITGQGELWKDRERDAVVVTGPGHAQHRLGVRRGVGEGCVVGAGGHPREPLAVGRKEIHASLLPETAAGYACAHE